MRVVSIKNILSNIDSVLRFIEDIVAITTDANNEHKAKTNLSFASKFTHYECFYLFEKDAPRKDSYSICDNVLNKTLLSI